MAWFPCNIGGGSPQYQEYDEGYFVESVSKTSGSASIKIIKQSADGTKEETVYTQSDASSEINIDDIFKFQYSSGWNFTLLQTIDGFKKGDTVGWGYDADADFFVITKYSWTANYEWLYNLYGSSKPTVTLTGRAYFKVYPHQTLIGYAFRGQYTNPLYVSTYKKACVFNTSAGGGPFTNPTEFEYKGKTWYVNTASYAMGGDVTDSNAIAIKVSVQGTMVDCAKYLIDNSGLRWMNESGSPVIPFEKEILHSIEQDQSGDPAPVSVTFTKDYPIAFICGLIADNVWIGNIGVNTLGGASPLYGISNVRYASAGIAVQLPSNKTLTGYFPYSDGGAYYDIFGAIGMSRLPSEYEVKATIDTSSISIELSKVYDHIVVFVGMNSSSSNSVTLTMNGTSIPLTVESEKFSRYSYHASEELTSNSTTLNFTYSGEIDDNTMVVFAYNE